MDIYGLLKMLSSESKSKIIVHFLDCKCGDVPVSSICKFTGLKQANVSKHIMTLRKENVFDWIKKGKEVIYTINPDFKSKWGNVIKSIMAQDETLNKLKCMYIKHNK